MEDPKISVIVPVYKVEPYLRKCLDSIVNQTYQNLEIILVDDGSPDNCGAICDEYAAKDNRMKVIHQENRGLSAARNTALKYITGEYIGFIDSDDWVEPDMYAYLLKNAIIQNADITVCGYFEEGKKQHICRGYPAEQLFDKEYVLQELLKNDMLQNSVCDKLWRREMFSKITFPEGQAYEDIAVMYRLILRASRVLCLPEAKYHYIQRPDSIIGEASLQNRIDFYNTAWRRMKEMEGDWPQLKPYLAGQCVASAIGIWCGYYANPKPVRQQKKKKIQEISQFSRSHYREALECIHIGKIGRMVVRLIPYPTWWSFAMAYALDAIHQWKHGRRL